MINFVNIQKAMNRLLLPGKHVCAIMGGHKLPRGCKQYRDAAKISRTLTRMGLFVCSGGGPGGEFILYIDTRYKLD